MYRHYNSKLQREVTIIHPGEYFATRMDVVISTVLGSCVAVALYDSSVPMGGLNHFMLPERVHQSSAVFSESGKYGVFAMELLINEMLRLGAQKRNLRAKVFGGGYVMHAPNGSPSGIPDANSRFAMEFLQTEGIPVDAVQTGGRTGRKIFLYAQTFKVLLQRVSAQQVAEVEREEEDYLEEIRTRKIGGEVTLF